MDAVRDKIEDCFELYRRYNGRQHDRIEREMSLRGWPNFSRRILYDRFERGKFTPGWIAKYNWRQRVQSPAQSSSFSLSSPSLKKQAKACTLNGKQAKACTLNKNRQKQRRLSKQAWRRRSLGVTRRSADIIPIRTFASHREPAPVDYMSRSWIDEITDFSKPISIAAPQPHGADVKQTQPDMPDVTTPEKFHEWLKTLPGPFTWEWPYQKYIYKKLEEVTSGKCRRLMIFLPPRHGKSELVTVRYAAWRLLQNPALNVILGSYNQGLANTFSRKIKGVISDDAERLRNADCGLRIQNDENIPAQTTAATRPVNRKPSDSHTEDPRSAIHNPQSDGPQSIRPMFPFVRPRLKNTEAHWETALGGGLRAVGVGAGVTGYGAGLMIIDDPVKSRAEAESKTYRERVWNWFNDDLYTRLEPNGAIILIQTRWHQDDLAGRLLKNRDEGGEEWEVINLPALAEDGQLRIADRGSQIQNDEAIFPSLTVQTRPTTANRVNDLNEDPQSAIHNPQFEVPQLADPLGRPLGKALCPERYNENHLAGVKRQIGSYSFASLYQQRPVPAEGGTFKRHWFTNIVDTAPPGLHWCRGYDLAVSTKSTADRTASFRVAYDKDGNLYIADGFCRRIEFPEQRRYIIDRIAKEHDTEHGIETPLHGKGLIQELRRLARLRGARFRGIEAKGDKYTRALPWIPLAEEGRVILVKGPWIDEFIDEACSFPAGTHDDQIDAVSLAVQMHAERPSKLYRF